MYLLIKLTTKLHIELNQATFEHITLTIYPHWDIFHRHKKLQKHQETLLIVLLAVVCSSNYKTIFCKL